MTTIATDGRSMAADGLCTGGGIVHGFNAQKVHRIKDGRLIGVSGSAFDIGAFVSWLEDGGDKPKLSENFEAIALAPDGSCVCWNEHCQTVPQELPAITGSGGEIALGAMLSGKSPAEAVAIAAKRDTRSGGTITVLHLEEANG